MHTFHEKIEASPELSHEESEFMSPSHHLPALGFSVLRPPSVGSHGPSSIGSAICVLAPTSKRTVGAGGALVGIGGGQAPAR